MNICCFQRVLDLWDSAGIYGKTLHRNQNHASPLRVSCFHDHQEILHSKETWQLTFVQKGNSG